MTTHTRRGALGLAAGAAIARPAPGRAAGEVDARIAAVEASLGGRIGAAGLHAGSGREAAYRADERFPLCSTFKLLAAGLVLRRVDRGQESLARRVRFGRADLVTYSPVTETHLDDGMPVAAICEAAVTRSDNTAGNLMLASFGGPAALTAFARSLGDEVTRLDRIEPALNEALPDDPRDTTSPAAMLRCVRRLALGDALSPGSRDALNAWLLANQTGAARIRAGAPVGWRVGDKTGTGERGAAGDVAVLWPPAEGTPVLLAIYLAGSARPAGELNAAIAELARIMMEAVLPR